jgi:hypothetical protein
MSREVKTVMLYRENLHVPPRSFGLSLWDFAGPAILALLVYILAVLVLAL